MMDRISRTFTSPELASPSELTTRRRVQKGQVRCDLGGGRVRGPRWPNSHTVTLAMGTWNVTLLGGKEPELVQEVERYWRYWDSRARLHAQPGLWNQTFSERLDSLLFWSCLRWEAASWCGLAYSLLRVYPSACEEPPPRSEPEWCFVTGLLC